MKLCRRQPSAAATTSLRGARAAGAAHPGFGRDVRISYAAALTALLAAALGAAGSPARAHHGDRDFADLSLTELLAETVTSASKKPTSILRTPAAISVVTQEDLRRLGITSLPEALRFVAGMEVARVNAHTWAISARGFQGQLADKLLVMIDGRTVYEFSFPGVNWHLHDVMLEDLDRIEVIRGPGASLWGANAVNGVVNVITKSSRDTQGNLVSVAAGNDEQLVTSLRHGGKLGADLHYRAFLKYFDRDGQLDSAGQDAPYDWQGLRGGFRFDWEPEGRDAAFLAGDLYAGHVRENVDSTQLVPPFELSRNQHLDNYSGHLIGRWTRTYANSSHLTVHGSYTHTDDSLFGSSFRDDVVDLDLERRFAPSPRQEVVWGAGVRLRRGRSAALAEPELSRALYTAFVQDEVSLVAGKLDLIVGSKVEHNDFTGFELQPSVRLLWTPAANQTVWGAASRAVRTPDAFENGARSNAAVFRPNPAAPPIALQLTGSEDVESERLLAYELGYRIDSSARVSFDLAAFYNRYRGLVDFVAGTPFLETSPAPVHLVQPLVAANHGAGSSHGAELAVQWHVNDSWRLAGDYTWLDFDFVESAMEFDHPNHQARLRSYLDLPGGWELNGAVAYVGGLHVQDVPSYVRLDLGAAFQITPAIELGVWGQNLLESRHAEFVGFQDSFAGEVPRTAVVRLLWRF
jgi:iron complex outermembrane recepter protein